MKKNKSTAKWEFGALMIGAILAFFNTGCATRVVRLYYYDGMNRVSAISNTPKDEFLTEIHVQPSGPGKPGKINGHISKSCFIQRYHDMEIVLVKDGKTNVLMTATRGSFECDLPPSTTPTNAPPDPVIPTPATNAPPDPVIPTPATNAPHIGSGFGSSKDVDPSMVPNR